MLRTAQVLTLIGSLAIALFGVLMGGAGLVAGFLASSGERLMFVTVSASFLALSAGLGLAMAWHSWQAIQGKPSRPFAIRRPGLVAIVFLCTVALGHMALSLDLQPVLILPPLHVLATALPAVFVLALVAKGLGTALSWRDTILQFGSGTFLSTALALVLELVLLMGLLMAILVALFVYGGLDTLEPLIDKFQDPALLQDPSSLASLATSPLVVASIFFVAAVAVPIIEEMVKTVGVGLFSYKRPTRAESFFWGIACGAGFAVAEGLFNSISGLDTWSAAVLLRLGATLLHCLTGGLVGLAWFEIAAERRWARGLGLFACSVGIHGFWNAVSISLTLISLTGLVNETGMAENGLTGLATLALFSTLAVAVLGTGLGLAALTRYVGRVDVAASVSDSLQGGSRVPVLVAVSPEPEVGDDPVV